MYSVSHYALFKSSGFINDDSAILSFNIITSNLSENQCYILSANFLVANFCQYYTNDDDNIFIKLLLSKCNENDYVLEVPGRSTAEVVIERPETCIKPPTSESPATIRSEVIAAVVLSIITILAIFGAIGVIIVSRRKTALRMKKNE